MSKLKLAFSSKHSYVLDMAPLAGVFRGRFALLQRILTLLALTYIVLSTLLLGVVILGYSTLDSALLAALLNSVIVLTAVWLGLMLLCGWSYVVDPPLFVPVLVFALLVTVTYLLSPGLTGQAGNPANTFGVVGTKMISVAGLSASIFLYYFVNAFVNT
ncbi:hypothetical protein KC640_01670, partial [Candidatus Dojkabacteria bacterium]|nr:hypothetical protein [Candidatus Dojkabacteria bacterium]